MEVSRAEISVELLEAARRVASSQGRSEREVLDDAVRGYVAAFRGGGSDGSEDLRALLDRMSSRFGDLGEDEAMRIAVREQRAFRRERTEGQSGSGGEKS